MTAIEEAARRAARAAVHAAAGRGRTSTDVASLIERFERHPDGYLHARVIIDGQQFYFHRRYGSWLAPGQVGTQSVLKEPEGLLGSVLGREVKFALSERSQPFDREARRKREEADNAKQQPAGPPQDSSSTGEAGSNDRVHGAGDSDGASEPVSPDGS